jgi:hypothetical protein
MAGSAPAEVNRNQEEHFYKISCVLLWCPDPQATVIAAYFPCVLRKAFSLKKILSPKKVGRLISLCWCEANSTNHTLPN